ELIGKMVLTAQKIAIQEGIAEDGYRLVINCNKHGCQVVFHMHMHLIGGKQLRGLAGYPSCNMQASSLSDLGSP
ncbi:MAG: HIT domain-containing protein, partial [Hyphomicrobiaceae bacterium]|nr:HIT domain-containing protein [Hyphomicrobiaceae bacterium]